MTDFLDITLFIDYEKLRNNNIAMDLCVVHNNQLYNPDFWDMNEIYQFEKPELLGLE